MFTLNTGQQFIVDQAVQWALTSPEQIFQFDGPPGSGKSVVLNEIIRSLGLDPTIDIAAMSFIGAASLVMRMKGLINSKTIHSWLYEFVPVPLKDKDGKPVIDALYNVPVMVPKFIPRKALPPEVKMIVIDEAYPTPASMVPEITKFGKKIIACGDQGQLPPVNDKPGFLVDGKIYHLTEVMRQQGRNDIVAITNAVRQGLKPAYGVYGNSWVAHRSQITDEHLLWADQIVCCKNSTRDAINARIRSILGKSTKLPTAGEKVVCRKNNWLQNAFSASGNYISLVNGLIGTVVNNPDITTFDGKMFSMDFMPMFDQTSLFYNCRCNYKHMISDAVTRAKIKNNQYEPGNMFEYAYAITAHVAQGGQWPKVLYFEENVHPSIQTNLNVVGASRASDSLIYVRGD